MSITNIIIQIAKAMNLSRQSATSVVQRVLGDDMDGGALELLVPPRLDS
jgi:hypothetical protein